MNTTDIPTDESVIEAIESFMLSKSSNKSIAHVLKWRNSPKTFSLALFYASIFLIVAGVISLLGVIKAHGRDELHFESIIGSAFIILLGYAGWLSTSRTLERISIAHSVVELIMKKRCEHAPPAGRGEAPRP